MLLHTHQLIILTVISPRACTDQMFEVIIRLHRNRILGRLGSRHFKRPDYERGPDKRARLPARLRKLMGELSSLIVRHSGSNELEALSHELSLFEEALQDLESSNDTTRLAAIGNAIKSAFDITQDGISLPTRLRSLGCPESELEARAVEEINKVANYWRICKTLPRWSRSSRYRGLFSGTRLETIEPYEKLFSNGFYRHVHAELQMISFYELSSLERWPRSIGASKDACFLCHAFVSAHGQFYLTRSHGQVFNQ